MYKLDLASNNLQWLICHQTIPSCSEALRSVEYSFIAITPMSTLMWNGSTC